MATSYELSAELRERTGKGGARATRREGMIPAVIYGENEPPLAIKVPYKMLDQRINAGGFFTRLATIEVGGRKIRVLPRDYQLDPVKDFPIHVDFLRVAEGARIRVEVPVHFRNEIASPGIKRGGVLNIVRHTVELDVPVDAIPEFITADLTGLDINDSLHISKIELPEGTVPTIDRDFTVATIAAPAGVKEEAREAAAAAAAAASAPAAEEAAAGEAKEGAPAAGGDKEKK
ncbi:MAG: 50S ribosomal protein L25/general stress protein Ctc [Bauldia sp.]|nr:50S ribosomal protein L25/general stress protein Ctc [Bauldia sp.]